MLHERVDMLTGNTSNNNRSAASIATNHISSSTSRVKRRIFESEKKESNDEFMAAALGDTEWLKQTLRNSKGLIKFDKNGLAPIHLAAIHGRLECLQLLIDKFKQDVNLPSTTGWRPAHLSISNQTGRRAFNCLSYLLGKGASPSIANDDGITPMHQAASEGEVKCLKLLIEAGAVIDGKDCRDQIPLDLAKLWGHKNCARILAAEMWHRNKDTSARDYLNLQRRRSNQSKRERDSLEEYLTERKLLGDISFDDWLDNHGLTPKPVGPQVLEKKMRSIDSCNIVGLLRSNSLQPDPAGTRKSPFIVDGGGIERTKEFMKKEIKEEDTESKVDIVISASTLKSQDSRLKNKESPTASMATVKTVKSETGYKPYYSNPKPWVKSLKLEPAEYVSILPDDYPRDEYTKLPKHPAQRQRKLPPLARPKSASSAGSPPKKEVTPEEPEDARIHVVYKCKNIIDVQRRQHFNPDDDQITRSEIALHLTNNVKSIAYQTALEPEKIPSTPSTGISLASSPCSLSPLGMQRSEGMSPASVSTSTKNYSNPLSENFSQMKVISEESNRSD